MANWPARPSMARAHARHGPIGVGPAWHAVPPGPCLTRPRAWPLAQARHYGPIFVPGRPEKHYQFHRSCQLEAHCLPTERERGRATPLERCRGSTSLAAEEIDAGSGGGQRARHRGSRRRGAVEEADRERGEREWEPERCRGSIDEPAKPIARAPPQLAGIPHPSSPLAGSVATVPVPPLPAPTATSSSPPHAAAQWASGWHGL